MSQTINKVAIVTGANSGIGKETCIGLSEIAEPFTIVMACRNLKLAEAVKEEIKELTKNENIHVMQLDLSDLESVKNFSEQLNKKFDKVDLLVNNAGLVSYNYTETTANNQTLEMQFCTNHLGHFYLTKQILPLLQKSPDARIVNVSSLAHYSNQSGFESYLDSADPTLEGEPARQQFTSIIKKNYSKINSYSHSKYANVLFTSELVERLKDDEKNQNIKCLSLHPGVIKTNLGGNIKNAFIRFISNCIFSLIGTTPKNGAKTTLHCCLADVKHVQEFNGYYFSKSKPVYYPYNDVKKQKYAKLLWELSERLIKS